MAGFRFAARFGRSAASSPRPCGLGSDPLRVSPLSVLGPLSVSLPPPLPTCQKVHPAAGNGLARRLVASAKHCFCRSRRKIVPSLRRLETGRHVRPAPCVAALSWRKCRLPSLLFMMIHSFFVGIIRAALSSFASLGRGSTISAGSLTLVTGQVFTIAVSDHASSSPTVGYCQGRASVWLVCGSPSRCGSDR